jgi:hypothetical protein
MKDWPDEKWLNVESENVRKIMAGRIQAAKDKGCMGVDADNVDGYVRFPPQPTLDGNITNLTSAKG